MKDAPERNEGSGPPGQSGKDPSPAELRAQRGWRILLWVLIGTIFFLWAREFMGPGVQDEVQVSYSTFRQHVEQDNVSRVTVQGEELRGELVQPAIHRSEDGEEIEYTRFRTYLPSFGDEALFSLLEDRGVELETLPDDDFAWWPVLLYLLPFLLILVIGFFILRRMRSQGQGMFSIGKSQAKLYDEETEERTTFDDVAGCQGAKRELQEVIAFLKDPTHFEELGAEVPRGVLLVGPPGTGKTLMARAVAGEAGVPFYTVTGSDFMEMFVGIGASRVRDLFDKAKESAPSIIFIDELDSIGRRRGAGLGGGHDEREQTLNQMLSELDGFEPAESVIVMAATNRPDILDPALLRPGRFDRRVTVGLPTAEDRVEILRLHARRKPLEEDVELEELARGTPGFSGADLKNLLNEAALIAARKQKTKISQKDVDEARDKVIMGLEREGMTLDEEELELLAYHEAGHATVAALMPHSDPLHKVTIIPRGQAMGVTQQLPEKEKYIYPKEYMTDRLAVIMGGRAAEDLVFDTQTSGAANDLQEATKLVRRMVLDWGMSEKLGPMASTGRREQVFLGEEIAQQKDYSDETAREVDQEVRRILVSCYDHARQTLDENRAVLDRVAELLLEKEELSGKEIMEIVEELGAPTESGSPDKGDPPTEGAAPVGAEGDGVKAPGASPGSGPPSGDGRKDSGDEQEGSGEEPEGEDEASREVPGRGVGAGEE